MSSIQAISSSDLLGIVETGSGSIIDIRSVDAYNGWRKRGGIRGGHIQGARSLPLKWFDYIDWIEIVRSKGIEQDKALVVYSYSEEESERAALQFQKAGYNDVRIYNHFLDEWVPDESYPMQHLARYRHLVSAEWLQTLITHSHAPEYENQKVVICHSHYQNPEDYHLGHIPGAIPLDTNSLESQETWNRRSPEELKTQLESMGIDKDSTVIVYGRFSYPDNEDPFPGSSAGHLGAFRCAFIMLYAGVKDVRILNGGLKAWEDAGYELSTDTVRPDPVEDFGVAIPGHPELAVDIDQAKEMIQAPDKNLVSVRSWREYIGEVSGYNYIQKKGRIPGSVFGNCGSDAYHMENYRNPDHTTREYHEIAANLAEVGVTPDKHNAFYCGTGWRGSEAFFNAWLMGWPRVSVFDGGWFEWSNDPDNPFETGDPLNR